MSDEIEVTGLAALLQDEENLPYLELSLRLQGELFRAVVLAAGDEWTVNVRDGRGKSCPGSGDGYDTQAAAIVGAMLIVVASTKHPFF